MGDIIATLKGLPLLAGLPDDVIAELAARLERQSLAPGQVLFRKGDPGDALYVIDKGEVKVFLEGDSGQEEILNQLGPGQPLGEMVIVDEGPRTASVTTLSPVEVLRLSRDDFLEVLSRQPPSVLDSLREIANRLRLSYPDILRGLPLLEGWPDDALVELATKLDPVGLREGEVLFRKGEPGDALYIIESGWVKIVTEDEQGEELILSQLGPGEAIGEMSLIDQGPRSAGVVALSPSVRMLELGSDDFLEVLARQPKVALDVMRNLSSKLRFATTYIEQAIEWSKRIADGEYDFSMHQIEAEQSAFLDEEQSDKARASQLLSAFFSMVKEVKEREEKLRNQLHQLTIQIDEAKRKEDFETLTGSAFFADLKATAQAMRQERADEET